GGDGDQIRAHSKALTDGLRTAPSGPDVVVLSRCRVTGRFRDEDALVATLPSSRPSTTIEPAKALDLAGVCANAGRATIVPSVVGLAAVLGLLGLTTVTGFQLVGVAWVVGDEVADTITTHVPAARVRAAVGIVQIAVVALFPVEWGEDAVAT